MAAVSARPQLLLCRNGWRVYEANNEARSIIQTSGSSRWQRQAAWEESRTERHNKKSQVTDPLFLHRTGFEGDAQGDTVRHGGSEKAVHHYPFDHYATWQSEIGAHALLDHPGAFGENVSTAGLSEADVAIGDTFRLDRALIQVSQGRQPCWKLNERFTDSRMARRVQQTGRTGWYYHVLEEGIVAPDSALMLVAREREDWTVQRIWHHFYVDTMNADALREIADLPLLAQGWRNHAEKRLVTGAIEDWSPRLDRFDGE